MTDQPRYVGEDWLIFALPSRAKVDVARLSDALRVIKGVEEVVPGMTDLSLRFDPLRVKAEGLRARFAEALACTPPPAPASAIPALTLAFSVPAPDTDDRKMVAKALGIDVDALGHWLEQRTFRVEMMGFQPGFAYLETLAPDLPGIPRLANPRQRVPAGSIGFLGRKACIYSIDGPGGWPIIGRITQRLFDPTDQAAPFLLQPGQMIRFSGSPT